MKTQDNMFANWTEHQNVDSQAKPVLVYFSINVFLRLRYW